MEPIEEIGIEVLKVLVEKVTNVVEDVRSKAEDGFTTQEIFQIVIGSSDEAVWIATHKKDIAAEIGDVEGDLTEGEVKELVEKIITEYQAPTPEEEYMVERILYAIFAGRDAYNAVTDFINSRK